jgi:hypothetical protein
MGAACDRSNLSCVTREIANSGYSSWDSFKNTPTEISASPTLPVWPNLKQSSACVRSPNLAHRADSAYFAPTDTVWGGMYDLIDDSFEPANPRQQQLRSNFSLPGW